MKLPFGRIKRQSRRQSSPISQNRGASARKTSSRKVRRHQLNIQPFWQNLRKLLSLILVVAFLGVLVSAIPAGWYWLNRPVASVGINGALQWTNEAQIKTALRPYMDERMLQVDLAGMRQSLLELQGVVDVSVRRAWPDRLEVTVTDEVAIARWHDSWLLDERGRAFRPVERLALNKAAELPLLSGPKGAEQQMLQQYLMLSRLLRPLGLPLERLELNTLGSWRLFSGEAEIVLGRQRLQERVHRLVSLYNDQLERRWEEVRRIDLRHSSSVAVAWANQKNPAK